MESGKQFQNGLNSTKRRHREEPNGNVGAGGHSFNFKKHIHTQNGR